MKSFLSTLFLFFPIVVCASNLPNEFIYNGKSIDPLCLFDFQTAKEIIDLNKCGLNTEAGARIEGKNKKLTSEGFIGYDYSQKLDTSMRVQGYSYYKTFGTVGSSVIVQTINNGGGNGSLSFLNTVERNGNTLKLSVLNGGDRCNGSLADIKRVGNGAKARLIYSVQLTGYDYLLLAKDNPHHVKPYDDLAACAACCAGQAVYERKIGPNFAKEKLLYVDASLYLKDIENATSNSRYQACFNKVLAEYGKKNNGKLTAPQLVQFTKQFNKECVH